MSTGRFHRLFELFEAARALQPDEWLAFLKQRAGEDQSLVDEVLSLLQEHARGESLILDRLRREDAEQSAREHDSGSAGQRKLDQLRARPHVEDQRYRLEGEVGRGGMGAVIRVHDMDIGRDLAMKVILGQAGDKAVSGSTSGLDPEVVQRFLDEAQITGQLDHPGVVPVHDLGVDAKGRVYFTMKLVRGETADAIFRRARSSEGGWTRTRALEVVLKVCDTMEFAHQKGVLHRDLKPSNVMVGRFGEVYVMDWGLAKVVGERDRRDLRVMPRPVSSVVRTDRSRAEAGSDSPVVTMDGAVVGTPSYMSPEQAEGRVELLDQRADVYAIGAMLYQLLTGQAPYVAPGARVSPYVVLAAVQAGPPAAIHRVDRNVPAELAAICEKAMSRDLASRYASVGDLAKDLRAFLDRRVVRAYRTGAVAELWTWVRRNRLLATVTATAVAAVVVALGLVVTLQGEQARLIRTASNELLQRADRLFLQSDEAKDLVSKQASAREGLLRLVRAIELYPANGDAWERVANEIVLRRNQWSDLSWRTLDPKGERSVFLGSEFLAMTGDRGVKIWKVGSWTMERLLEHSGRVTGLAVSENKERIAVASASGEVVVWDWRSGEKLLSLKHPEAFPRVRFVGSDLAIMTSSENVVRMWSAVSGSRRLEVSTEKGCAAISPDGSCLITRVESRAQLLCLNNKVEPVDLLVGSPAYDLAEFDVETRRVLVPSRGGLCAWDLFGVDSIKDEQAEYLDADAKWKNGDPGRGRGSFVDVTGSWARMGDGDIYAIQEGKIGQLSFVEPEWLSRMDVQAPLLPGDCELRPKWRNGGSLGMIVVSAAGVDVADVVDGSGCKSLAASTEFDKSMMIDDATEDGWIASAGMVSSRIADPGAVRIPWLAPLDMGCTSRSEWHLGTLRTREFLRGDRLAIDRNLSVDMISGDRFALRDLMVSVSENGTTIRGRDGRTVAADLGYWPSSCVGSLMILVNGDKHSMAVFNAESGKLTELGDYDFYLPVTRGGGLCAKTRGDEVVVWDTLLGAERFTIEERDGVIILGDRHLYCQRGREVTRYRLTDGSENGRRIVEDGLSLLGVSDVSERLVLGENHGAARPGVCLMSWSDSECTLLRDVGAPVLADDGERMLIRTRSGFAVVSLRTGAVVARVPANPDSGGDDFVCSLEGEVAALGQWILPVRHSKEFREAGLAGRIEIADLRRLANILTGMRLDGEDMLSEFSGGMLARPELRQILVEELARLSEFDSPLGRLTRWLQLDLRDPANPFDPSGQWTCGQVMRCYCRVYPAASLVRTGTGAYEYLATLCMPNMFTTTENRRTHLAAIPDVPADLGDAAEMLLFAGEDELALQAANRALALDPTEPSASWVKSALRR